MDTLYAPAHAWHRLQCQFPVDRAPLLRLRLRPSTSLRSNYLRTGVESRVGLRGRGLRAAGPSSLTTRRSPLRSPAPAPCDLGTTPPRRPVDGLVESGVRTGPGRSPVGSPTTAPVEIGPVEGMVMRRVSFYTPVLPETCPLRPVLQPVYGLDPTTSSKFHLPDTSGFVPALCRDGTRVHSSCQGVLGGITVSTSSRCSCARTTGPSEGSVEGSGVSRWPTSPSFTRDF